MILNEINELLLFFYGVISGISTYITFITLYLLFKRIKNRYLKEVFDFITILSAATIYILFNYLFNYMEIKWYMLLANVLSIIIVHTISILTIAKIKNIMYNKNVR